MTHKLKRLVGDKVIRLGLWIGYRELKEVRSAVMPASTNQVIHIRKVFHRRYNGNADSQMGKFLCGYLSRTTAAKAITELHKQN